MKKRPKRLSRQEQLEREVLSRVHVPPYSVKVAGPTVRIGGTSYGDGVFELSFKDPDELLERLRWLEKVIFGTADELGGSGTIVILRRKKR